MRSSFYIDLIGENLYSTLQGFKSWCEEDVCSPNISEVGDIETWDDVRQSLCTVQVSNGHRRFQFLIRFDDSTHGAADGQCGEETVTVMSVLSEPAPECMSNMSNFSVTAKVS